MLHALWLWILGIFGRRPKLPPNVVYCVRHQGVGLMSNWVFAEPPTEKQLSAIKASVAKHWPRAPGKEDWWVRVVPVPLLDRKTLPLLPAPPEEGSRENVSRQPQFQSYGTGVYTPPKKA